MAGQRHRGLPDGSATGDRQRAEPRWSWKSGPATQYKREEPEAGRSDQPAAGPILRYLRVLPDGQLHVRQCVAFYRGFARAGFSEHRFFAVQDVPPGGESAGPVPRRGVQPGQPSDVGGARYYGERSGELWTNHERDHEPERKSNGAVGAEALFLILPVARGPSFCGRKKRGELSNVTLAG